MRSTMLCVALAVVGWMVCGNSHVAFAQEATDHQATQHRGMHDAAAPASRGCGQTDAHGARALPGQP